jgi:hypothetical protein
MKCPRCQRENLPQAKFCLECGTPLAFRCSNCGTQLPAGDKFCFECAAAVGLLGSQPRFASPEYTRAPCRADHRLEVGSRGRTQTGHCPLVYREMGMTYWLAKAEAEMVESG